MNLKLSSKLNRSFYTREILDVAKDLLGKILVKKEDDKIISGKNS